MITLSPTDYLTLGTFWKHSLRLRLWRTEFFQPTYDPRKKSNLQMNKNQIHGSLLCGILDCVELESLLTKQRM